MPQALQENLSCPTANKPCAPQSLHFQPQPLEAYTLSQEKCGLLLAAVPPEVRSAFNVRSTQSFLARSSSQNPSPHTPNSKASPRSPQPSTRNPKSQTPLQVAPWFLNSVSQASTPRLQPPNPKPETRRPVRSGRVNPLCGGCSLNFRPGPPNSKPQNHGPQTINPNRKTRTPNL